MTDQKPELDSDTLAFVGRVFQFARMGHAEELATLFGQGLPANLRNDKGDSLLMLAAYNGQHEATRVILEAGAIPNSPTTGARRPWPEPPSRAISPWPNSSSRTGRRWTGSATAPARR